MRHNGSVASSESTNRAISPEGKAMLGAGRNRYDVAQSIRDIRLSICVYAPDHYRAIRFQREAVRIPSGDRNHIGEPVWNCNRHPRGRIVRSKGGYGVILFQEKTVFIAR